MPPFYRLWAEATSVDPEINSDEKRQGNNSDILCVCIFPLVEQGGCGHLVASRFDK